MKKFSEYINEKKDNMEVGQIWAQKKSNYDNASQAQLQKREEELQDPKRKNVKPYNKVKDVIEIISFLGKNSVDVKSSELNKIVTLDRRTILSDFELKG